MKSYSIQDIVPQLKPSVLSYAGIFEDTPDPDIEWPHRHRFCSLVWFTEGNGINVIDFNEYQITTNRIFAISPGQIHNWNYSIDCKGYFLLIEEHFARHLQLDFNFSCADILPDDLVLIREIFQRLILDKNRETAIQYLFSILKTSVTESKAGDNTVFEYKKLITKDYTSIFSIRHYAGILGLTTEELTHICKTQTGLTAKQLQLDIRITETKRLLLYTSLNINEIAFRLGFEDSSYFARIFKRKTHLSPIAFREKYLKNRNKS